MVVRFDLEGAGPAVAHVDDAGIFAGPLHHAVAFCGQALQVHAAGLVGAVLAPHHAVDAELGEGGRAAEGRENAIVLLRSDAVLGQQLRGYGGWLGNDGRGGMLVIVDPPLSHDTCGAVGAIRPRSQTNTESKGTALARGLAPFAVSVRRQPQPAVLCHAQPSCPKCYRNFGIRNHQDSRDGGTGRRSRLKICRPLWSWGFDPPSRHQKSVSKLF